LTAFGFQPLAAAIRKIASRSLEISVSQRLGRSFPQTNQLVGVYFGLNMVVNHLVVVT